MPKVSVLMPVYNTKEEYLREAIESILNQTYKDFEFIILNDGSTNNAEEVILSYKDPRIKYYKQENQGLPKTRNKLMDLSNGEYLAWADSDDIHFPTRLEKHVKILDEMPNIGIVSNWLKITEQNKTINNPEYPRLLDFFHCCPISQGCSTFRKSTFKKLNLKYDENFMNAEDYELWSRAILFTNFYNIQEILTIYRWHETNISQIDHDLQFSNDAKVKKRILDLLTLDQNKQNEILKIITTKKSKWYPKMFSIKNEYRDNKKIKTIKILNYSIEIYSIKIKKIDLVYLWVDSNDKQWQKKKKDILFYASTNEIKEATNECRFINNNELKYSLRSVEKYAKWINHIYIITDNQTPDWLNTNNHKISIINQNHILPNNSKYCFNSCAIEHCIKNIPYLSEYFLLANDDMFFNKKTKPSFFFTKTGKIIYRHFGFLGRMGNYLYANQLINASNIIEKKYKQSFLLYPHHNIDGYRKSIVNACYNEFKNEIDETISHPLRTAKDIQRTIYSNYASAIGKAKLKKVTSNESLYMTMRTKDKINELKKHKPYLFCINDTELCTDKDRQETKKFLEFYFPEKSIFEK